jgi:predicted ATPase
VQWSYDPLGDAKKSLLEWCSVFSGGFDLQSACAVAGFDDADDYVVLDQLDALMRKSLLVVDRSTRRTRFRMLETIRQFAGLCPQSSIILACNRVPVNPGGSLNSFASHIRS